MDGPVRSGYIPASEKLFRAGVHASDQIITSIHWDTYFGDLFFFTSSPLFVSRMRE